MVILRRSLAKDLGRLWIFEVFDSGTSAPSIFRCDLVHRLSLPEDCWISQKRRLHRSSYYISLAHSHPLRSSGSKLYLTIIGTNWLTVTLFQLRLLEISRKWLWCRWHSLQGYFLTIDNVSDSGTAIDRIDNGYTPYKLHLTFGVKGEKQYQSWTKLQAFRPMLLVDRIFS